jgi:hypothetical protein
MSALSEQTGGLVVESGVQAPPEAAKPERVKLVPEHEIERVNGYIETFDRLCNPDAALATPTGKDMHPVSIMHVSAEVVQYGKPDGSVVRSLEIPKKEIGPSNERRATALNITTGADGTLEADKEELLVRENGLIPLGKRDFDEQDYKFLGLCAEKMKPRLRQLPVSLTDD